MSKSNVFEAGLLALTYQNQPFTLLGDAAGLRPSAVPGNIYIRLHTADPGEAGDQSTSEVTYTNYAAVAVPRTTSDWTISGSAPTQVVPAAATPFPQGGAGAGSTATHFSTGTSPTGAGKILHKGALTPPIVCGNGVTPNPSITVTED